MQYNPDQIILAVGSQNGIYTPQIFFENYAQYLDTPAQQWEELKNPNHTEYWEAWDDLLNDATLTIDGKQYRVEQNEDVWLIPVDMELPEDWYI
jgi:hypothetical protein